MRAVRCRRIVQLRWSFSEITAATIRIGFGSQSTNIIDRQTDRRHVRSKSIKALITEVVNGANINQSIRASTERCVCRCVAVRVHCVCVCVCD